MSDSVKRIDSIKNMAVFQDFDWSSSVRDSGNNISEFRNINIFYGRNYSGKTTVSRIFRAFETGFISDKYDKPEFQISFLDKTILTQNNLSGHGKIIRVFNEDFVRDNLRFISNPDDCIESFAILGDDNNKIEKEIEELEEELGSKKEGQETGLYAEYEKATSDYKTRTNEYNTVNSQLENQLSTKATDRAIGIKYKPERFGDQNYTIAKLRSDILEVLAEEYKQLNTKEISELEKLISEKTLQSIPVFNAPSLSFLSLADQSETLIIKKVGESGKIEELVKEAILNKWVSDGCNYHKDKREKCAFCGNSITESRWSELEMHFDKESEELEKNIESLIIRIEKEKTNVNSALNINKSQFYSKYHVKIDELIVSHRDAVSNYTQSLDALVKQLTDRKNDILNTGSFEKPDDFTDKLVDTWKTYNKILNDSNNFSSSLSAEQGAAKKALRLKEVSDYIVTINYKEKQKEIADKKTIMLSADDKKKCIKNSIDKKEDLIKSKKHMLNDEEKGARKVNEYLNNFFGHKFITLEAQKKDNSDGESKQIRFEVIRDGKKAYHLSEGECSLLSFCYFLAKLDDIDTKNSKPIIWIDDPISSLDANHIFFVYSLLYSEIISNDKFEQLFVSTHNLDFLKYLKRLPGALNKKKSEYFIINRTDQVSKITLMPKYLREYVTEFNFLFHQIYKCAHAQIECDENHDCYYNFGNNARKFLEAFLYYKYPNAVEKDDKLLRFFGDEPLVTSLTDRINNEFSHLEGIFERSVLPVDVPEMKTTASFILKKIKEKDPDQYSALLQSIGVTEKPAEESQTTMEDS